MPETTTYSVIFNAGKNEDGSQRNIRALVWKEPVEGKSYHAREMYVLGDDGGYYAAPNDEGNIPHREASSPDEDLGVTWHYAKL